jgi:hypothetical protein
MTSRRQLERRRAALIERCAVQRVQLGEMVMPFANTARGFDSGMKGLRQMLTRPAAVVLGIAIVALIIRSRGLRVVGGTLGLASTAWRAGSLVSTLLRNLRADGTGARKLPIRHKIGK